MTDDTIIQGGAELQRFLDTLPAKLEGNILRSALRKGARVVQQDARARAPVASGELRDGIKLKSGLRYGIARVSVVTTGKHAFLAQWMEYGTQSHVITAGQGKALAFLVGGHPVKAVEHPGIRPHPFMRPALDANTDAAVSAIAGQIRARLTKAGIDLPDEGDAA